MKNSTFLFLLIVVLAQPSLYGQKIKRDVLCTSGGASVITVGSNTIRLSCTVGQPPNAGTDSNNLSFLRQGFEQPPLGACSAAPQAEFSVEEIDSGNCGKTFNFTYEGIPNMDTQFYWDFGSTGIPTSSLDPSPQNVRFSAPGTFTVTLYVTTGSCENIATHEVEIIQISTLNAIVADKMDALCFDIPDGSIMLSISGGQQPYQINWSNGESGEEISNLTAGIYQYSITDSEGCTEMDTVEILGGDSISIIPFIVNETCVDILDGSINLDVSGGEAPYQFLWSDSTITDEIANLAGGLYSLTVTDFNNCQKELNDIEVKIGCLDFDFRTGFTPNGDGVNDTWTIPDIENFPENRLEVFNRWGSLVFEKEHYDNSWQGTKTNGEPLPTGAYYFVLMLNNEANTVLSGSVTILR